MPFDISGSSVDPAVIGQLNSTLALSSASIADAQAKGNLAMGQLSLLIASGNAHDQRILSAYIANEMATDDFNDSLVKAKSAFETPNPPMAAPMTTPVATK